MAAKPKPNNGLFIFFLLKDPTTPAVEGADRAFDASTRSISQQRIHRPHSQHQRSIS